MLKKLAAEALGISDIGKIILPENYGNVDADDYVLHEDQEKIYFLIKSKTDEYCFTNLALIHVDGTSAINSKKLLKRYDYYQNPISNVLLETAGTIDLDAEIKFSIGEKNFSIDVDKKQIEQLKDLYKALLRMSQIVKHNAHQLQLSHDSLSLTTSVLNNCRLEGNTVSDEFEKINTYAFDWMTSARDKYIIKDFGTIFERYINN